MTPKDFPQVNFTFTKPSSMTDEQCGSLPVHKGTDTEGFPVIVSCWQLTPEELEQVKDTGEIFLSICGQGMPPVSLSTTNPCK